MVGGEPVVFKNRTFIHYGVTKPGKSSVYMTDLFGNLEVQ